MVGAKNRQKKKFLGKSFVLHCADGKHGTKKTQEKKSKMKNCKNCKKCFTSRNKTQIYCSRNCNSFFNAYEKEFCNITTGTIGAIQELRVSIDLLSRGFEVYRALSPSSSSDLIAKKDNQEFSIEVRTGYVSRNGKIIVPTRNMRSKIFAVVVSKDRIVYSPEIF